MPPTDCKIVPVGKRRDGGTRYWCLEHKADATAKYGRRGRRCRYAGVPEILPKETATIDVAQYQGGVALWGAVPPVYDTTRLAIDKGIHLHARLDPQGPKIEDRTLRKVELIHEGEMHSVSELDAIYFMVSAVFGFSVKHIACTRCGHPHLDKDWFSVHPHQSHLCAGCGKTFRDSETGIGNPVASVRALPFAKPYRPRRARKRLRLRQAEYPGGIRIWGSNPAILWTSTAKPEAGVHVHAYTDSRGEPAIDDTFDKVTVDDTELDAKQVRMLMAQSALPHLAGRLCEVSCHSCGESAVDDGANAYTPRIERDCGGCRRPVRASRRIRKVVSNPLIGTLERLAQAAPRSPQVHDLGLLPETL